jgi:hypothetical protein
VNPEFDELFITAQMDYICKQQSLTSTKLLSISHKLSDLQKQFEMDSGYGSYSDGSNESAEI